MDAWRFSCAYAAPRLPHCYAAAVRCRAYYQRFTPRAPPHAHTYATRYTAGRRAHLPCSTNAYLPTTLLPRTTLRLYYTPTPHTLHALPAALHHARICNSDSSLWFAFSWFYGADYAVIFALFTLSSPPARAISLRASSSDISPPRLPLTSSLYLSQQFEELSWRCCGRVYHTKRLFFPDPTPPTARSVLRRGACCGRTCGRPLYHHEPLLNLNIAVRDGALYAPRAPRATACTCLPPSPPHR